jgi:cephalosporin hydroxylase
VQAWLKRSYRRTSHRLKGRYPPVPKPEFRRQFGDTIPAWLHYHHYEILKSRAVTWMGVPTLKNPLDAWIYQEILFEVRPQVVVEIGSWSGGSTLFFAQLLDLLGGGQVISIDIDRTPYRVRHPRIVEITGDSGSPEVHAQVGPLCAGKSTLVVHDGNHGREAVLKDLHTYAQWVSVGSYLIVEDGIVDVFEGRGLGSDSGEGPLLAVDEFLLQRRDFAVDASRERYRITYNPRGYLKRLS